MNLKLLISLFAFNYVSQLAFGQLIINEVASCHTNEDTADWIEIFNTSKNNIDLSNYYLSDKPSQPQKWQFPAVELKSNGYLIVFASGKNENINNELHTNFKIDADGETILLSTNKSTLSTINVPALTCNFSFGYLNIDSLIVFSQPTPGQPNNLAGASVALEFSHNSGIYKDTFALNIYTNYGAEIRYTLNTALAPTMQSNLLTDYLNITNRAGDENFFSTIPTTDTSTWKLPKEEIFKINIIRAAAFVNGKQVSKIYTKSYGISPLGHQRYSFPIVSLVGAPHHFFSDSIGIYVLGDSYTQNALPNFVYDWERPVFVEFFENDGEKVISQQAEIEIAGQTTRWRRQKSLKLKASGKGNKNRFKHSFFDSDINQFKTLILRSPLTDYRKSFIKDQFVNNLAKKIGLAHANCRPVIVFLNGEYWGIHILEEKLDKYYFEDHFGVDKDSIHLLQKNPIEANEIIEGKSVGYLLLREYASNNNLNEPQHYKFIDQHLNIENYINYYCFNMLIATRDWPWNNIKYWRPANQSRKWEWVPHDFDSSYNYSQTDGFALAAEPANESVAWSVLLFNSLMENDGFKYQLLFRLEELLNNQFCADSIKPLIDEYKKLYQPEIAEHIARWNFEETYNWEEELAIYHKFPDVLSKVLKQIVKDDFEYEMLLCDSFNTTMDSLATTINKVAATNQSLVNIYPNPASNSINLQYNSHHIKIEKIYIYNTTGTLFLQIEKLKSTPYSIDINLLPVGLYYIKVLTPETNFTVGNFIKL